MRSIHKTFLVALFAICLGVNAAEPTFELGPLKEQSAVAEQVQKVILLLDSGEVGASWEASAPPLKGSTSKLAYVAGIKAMRGAVGDVVSRKLQGIGFMTNMPGAPPGQYAGAFLETTFSRAASVEEKLVFYKFQGNWQLAGYFLKKRFAATSHEQESQPSPQLQSEIKRLMTALGWDRMIKISLERGDPQRMAKQKLGAKGVEISTCIDENYTAQRMLERIELGYTKVFSNPSIVGGIADYMENSSAQKQFDRIAKRSTEVGAAVAHSELKSKAPNAITPSELTNLEAFSKSPAGKAYVESQVSLKRVHLQELSQLADDVAKQCQPH